MLVLKKRLQSKTTMVRTRRGQRDNMELFEEEFEEYAPADELDVNIARETGDEVEDGSAGVENRDEADYNEVIQELRKNCVSESSQKSYMGSMVNMLNWFARNEQSDDYRGPRPLTESWKVGLAAFDLNDDKRRKAWLKTKLDSADVNDPPINFETFDPGKFF